MKVWVTRAEPGASATAERLRVLGHAPLVAPLLAIEPLPAPDLAPELLAGGVGALAFTSRNGVAAATRLPELARWRDPSVPAGPVFAVGEATAQAARAAGFPDVRSADGDLPTLSALIAASRAEIAGAVLHLGAQEPAGVLTGGEVPVRAIAVYRAVERPLPAAVPAAWPELDAVLIHSPRAARALAAAAAALDPAHLLAICISEAAAAPLGAWPGEIRIAPAPTETALLAHLGKPARKS